MSLFAYLQQTQRFLREHNQTFLNPEDLISYINRARREVAMRGQAIRVLTPISGSIVSWTVDDAGSGYTDTPTLTVSEPDLPSGTLPFPNGDQATAEAIVQSGSIAAIFSSYGGAGYFQPTLTIEDSTGADAEASATLSWINTLNQGQEVYAYSDIDLSAFPGCESVYYVRSISILYSNYRYSLPNYAFSTYQSMIRQYPRAYQYVPAFFSQFGQGTAGSVYVYPLPSQTYAAEWDCQVIPSDLIDDQSYDALPAPWTEAVPYMAAHLAMIELQNFNAARAFMELYEKWALLYSQYARVGRVTNPYGRY
jgi:hypothetical protein